VLPYTINANPIQDESIRLRSPEDHQIRGLAGVEARLGPAEEPGGVAGDGGQDFRQGPAGSLQEVPDADLESLIRTGQVGCSGHDDLTGRVDGPRTVRPRG